ncbi:MAG: hypothetical protein MUF04_06330, partial [Akkermansiaceae bacterium]|nr:hypothetical protein [Akkermansiaceae bacterium]
MKPTPHRPRLTSPLLVAALCAANILPASADLIAHEPFNYTLDATNPDPDGGLNSNNGLPATNATGNPTGTSTGLRNTWGTATKVVAGLTYSGLTTSANALVQTNATWQDGPFVYRFMTTDPYLSLRVGGVNNGNFGADNTTLFFSYLCKIDDLTKTNRLVWAG